MLAQLPIPARIGMILGAGSLAYLMTATAVVALHAVLKPIRYFSILRVSLGKPTSGMSPMYELPSTKVAKFLRERGSPMVLFSCVSGVFGVLGVSGAAAAYWPVPTRRAKSAK